MWDVKIKASFKVNESLQDQFKADPDGRAQEWVVDRVMRFTICDLRREQWRDIGRTKGVKYSDNEQ